MTVEQRKKLLQENEEKKAYLQGYKNLKQKIRRLEEQLEELRLGEMSPGLTISDMPSGHNQRDLSDYIVKYDRLFGQIIKAKNEAADRMNEIKQQIEMVSDENERTVLTLRYLRNYSWEKICVEMTYSWRQIHYIHSRALEHFKMIA